MVRVRDWRRQRAAMQSTQVELFVHVAHVERLPKLHAHYAASSSIVSRATYMITVSAQRTCNSFCSSQPHPLSCNCFVPNATMWWLDGQPFDRGWAPGPHHLAHVNLCSAAVGGLDDVLFIHADMWVQLERLPLQAAAILLPSASSGASGLEAWFPPAFDHPRGCPVPAHANRRRTYQRVPSEVHGGCVPLAMVAHECSWHWMWDARVECTAAAAATNASVCCFGWADILYVPRALVAPFGRALGGFAGVHHEVAVATVLRLLATRDPARAAVRALQCHGSCCARLSPDGFQPDPRTSDALCGHRLKLNDEKHQRLVQSFLENRWVGRSRASDIL